MKMLDSYRNLSTKNSVRFWEHTLLNRLSFWRQVSLSSLICCFGFLAVYLAEKETQSYFPVITVLTTILISVVGHVYLNILFIIALVLWTDFYYIEPLGSVLVGRASLEHFLIVTTVGLIINLLVVGLRESFRQTYQAKIEAQNLVEKKTSELEQRETELNRARLKAEEASAAKSEFLANMSHEIRTPLAAVMGFSELIIRPEISSEQKAQYVSIILKNGELLASIINDILDLAKTEAGKLEMNLREVNLAVLMSDVESLFRHQAELQQTQLKLEIADDVPKIILTDALRLKQILINIVGNAIKFSPKASVCISVLLQPLSEEDLADQLAIQVSDTGLGIEAGQIDKLFAPFSQAHSAQDKDKGGTGLGLALSRRLARMLGGNVVLTRTQWGEGSTFTISINPGPIFKGNIREISSDSLSKLNAPKAPDLQSMRILVAEDSTEMRLLITQILKLSGASVESAENGELAYTKATTQDFDLILMDLQMPILSGDEVTKRLRASGYSGMIMALTAHALRSERQRYLAAGFDSYITKPIQTDLLMHEIERLRRRPRVLPTIESRQQSKNFHIEPN